MIEIKNMAGAVIMRVDGDTLRGADLRNSRLLSADLRGADLSNADLRGANLRYANLKHAVLCGANLARANLSNANLGGADLSKANLEGADLNSSTCRGANFNEANLSGAKLSYAYLNNASFCGAVMCHTDLRTANLTQAVCYGADFRKANLNYSDMQGADLSNTDLRGATWVLANLNAALLNNALLNVDNEPLKTGGASGLYVPPKETNLKTDEPTKKRKSLLGYTSYTDNELLFESQVPFLLKKMVMCRNHFGVKSIRFGSQELLPAIGEVDSLAFAYERNDFEFDVLLRPGIVLVVGFVYTICGTYLIGEVSE